jgi:hypothetical protein
LGASIVIELQRLASESHTPVADLLRKALIVATKLNISDFRDWIQKELNGYNGALPDYRKLTGRLSAVTPYGEQPIAFGDAEIDEMVSTARMNNGVAELEQLRTAQKALHVVLSGNQIQSIQRAFPHRQFIPQLVISPASVGGILDTVRNVVLDWALRLEQQGILGDGMSFSDDEKKKAATSQTIHIGSFSGVFGDVKGENVQIGDFGTINEQLKQAGVSQAERNELGNIMDALKKAKPEDKPGLIQRGMDWVGKNAANLGAIAGALRAFFGEP